MSIRDLLEFLDGAGIIVTDLTEAEEELNKIDLYLSSEIKEY